MCHTINSKPRKHAAILCQAFLGAVVFIASAGIANAVSITGSMGITGAYTANDTLDAATLITLTSATGSSGTDDVGATVGFGTLGTVNNGAIDIASFAPVTNLLTIGGWQLDLTSLSITDQTVNLLTMSGSGILSGNTFDPTVSTWTFSAQATGSSYSLTVTAAPVPVPAAVWLFGSGLLGLVGIARKRRN